MSRENYNLRTMNEALKELQENKNIFTCCICGEEVEGYGNNPYPVREDGECCDYCNAKFVIPARLKALKDRENSYTDDTDIAESINEDIDETTFDWILNNIQTEYLAHPYSDVWDDFRLFNDYCYENYNDKDELTDDIVENLWDATCDFISDMQK